MFLERQAFEFKTAMRQKERLTLFCAIYLQSA